MTSAVQYLLDTDMCIYLLNGDKRVKSRVFKVGVMVVFYTKSNIPTIQYSIILRHLSIASAADFCICCVLSARALCELSRSSRKNITGFFDIVSGFKKIGINLNDDELDAIRGFLESDAISPKFVNKLVHEYGDKSMRVACLIPDKVNQYYLDFLFRRHKGHFYRKRYPTISLLNGNGVGPR